MIRVPNTGPAEGERRRLDKLERDLRRLEAISPARREAEHADVAEQMCRALLADLRAGRPLVVPEAPPQPDPLEDLLGWR